MASGSLCNGRLSLRRKMFTFFQAPSGGYLMYFTFSLLISEPSLPIGPLTALI